MRGAEGGSRLGHVKSDARRGLHCAAHRPVVTLPKRRKPEGRSRSGDRGVLPHTATKGFARSYRINLRLLPELAFSSEHDAIFRLRSRLSKRTRAFEPLLARFLRLKSPRRVNPSAIAPRRSGCGRGLVQQNAPTPRGSRALVAPDARHCPKLASVRTAHRARIRSAGRPAPSAAGPAPGKEALPFPSPFRV